MVGGGILAAVVFLVGNDDKKTSDTVRSSTVSSATTETTGTATAPSDAIPTSTVPSQIPTADTGGTVNKPALTVARQFLTDIKAGKCKAAYALGGTIFNRTYKNGLACTDSWRRALSDWSPNTPGLYYDQTIFGRYKFDDGTVVSLQQENGRWVILSYIPSF
jgi:hypothetical protein